LLKLRCNTSQLWVPLASANQDKPLNYHVKTTPNNSKTRKSTPFRKKNAKGPHHCHLTLNTAARSSPRGPSESAQTQLNDICVGSLSRTACSIQHCPGLQRKRRRAFQHIAASSSVATRGWHRHTNTARGLQSPLYLENTHISPRRRVVP
jgi:hypothetical protein